MKFRPNAPLDTSQITDLRRNMGFYYWLQQQQMSPFQRMQLPYGPMSLPTALVKQFAPQYLATRRR